MPSRAGNGKDDGQNGEAPFNARTGKRREYGRTGALVAHRVLLKVENASGLLTHRA